MGGVAAGELVSRTVSDAVIAGAVGGDGDDACFGSNTLNR